MCHFMPMFSSELPVVDDQCPPAGHSWLVSPHSVGYPVRKWMSYVYIYTYWLVVSNMAGLFSIIYGMSSFPLTHIIQRGGSTTNQYNYVTKQLRAVR